MSKIDIRNLVKSTKNDRKKFTFVHGNLKTRVFSMRVMNTDAKSYATKTLERCLHNAAKAKKKKYLEACLQKCRQFPPFIVSVDGLLGVEAAATLKRISSHLSTKWKKLYSGTRGYVKSQITITLVWATNQFIRVSRVPAH